MSEPVEPSQGSAAGVPAFGDHAAFAPLVGARAGLVAAMAAPAWSASPEERSAALVEVEALTNTLAAYRLHVVRQVIDTEPATGRAVGGAGASTAWWMVDHLGMSRGRARAEVAAARATDPDDPAAALPRFGEALAEGSVRREHLDTAVRTLAQLPGEVVRERGAEIDAFLTGMAREFNPSDAQLLHAQLVATLAPEGLERSAAAAHELRRLAVAVRRDGQVGVEGALDPVGGARFKTVLDHLADPARGAEDVGQGSTPEGGGAAATVPQRTSAQRLADALVRMADLAASALSSEVTPSVEPARVVVHVTPEQLTHPDPLAPQRGPGGGIPAGLPLAAVPGGVAPGKEGPSQCADHRPPGAAVCEGVGPISARALHTHACDAIFDRVVIDRAGAVVQMESLGRLATRAQRRALAARDGGCAWPGCSAPPTWCDAHHIVWWSRGGPTTLANLVLLCPHHHSEAHREHWQIEARDGVPFFVPPRWLDPDQTPRRNTLHTATAATRTFGQRLLSGRRADDLHHALTALCDAPGDTQPPSTHPGHPPETHCDPPSPTHGP